MPPSNISMQVHTKHLPTRITIHSDLHLFLHTVHLDLYNTSLKCHPPGLQSETGIREGINTVTLQPPVKFALPWRGVQTVQRTMRFFMNTPNKIFWISHVFKLRVYLLPFMITDSQDYATPPPPSVSKLWNNSPPKYISAKQPHLILTRQTSNRMLFYTGWC
jgi:hypothetical protein